EAGRLQRADRGLATRARDLHEDVHLLHAVLLRLARSGLRREAGGEGGRLARALEADVAAGGPRDHGARRVRDRHDRVVDRALDMGLAGGDVLLVLAARLAPSGGASHGRQVLLLSWCGVVLPRGSPPGTARTVWSGSALVQGPPCGL